MAIAAHHPSFDHGLIIARAYDVLRRNLGLLAALTMLLYGLPKIGATVLHLAADDMPIFGEMMGFTGAIYSLLAFAGYFALQAVVVYVFAKDLSGGTPSFGGALRVVGQAFFPVAGVVILSVLVVCLGLAALIIPGLMIATAWLVATPACVAERLGVGAAIERSLWLTRGYRWPLFGFIAAAILAIVILTVAVGGFGLPFDSFDLIESAFSAAGEIIEALLSIIITLALALLVSSIYYELRVIKEDATPEDLALSLD